MGIDFDNIKYIDENTRSKLVSDYISSEQVNWENKSRLLKQQIHIENLIKSSNTDDQKLYLLLIDLRSSLLRLYFSIKELDSLLKVQGE